MGMGCVLMEPDDKPTLYCLVAYPLTADVFSDPALVSLELAAELKTRGYLVVGPDPANEIELALWERTQHQPRKKWFEP